jgi:hypothetical protein
MERATINGNLVLLLVQCKQNANGVFEAQTKLKHFNKEKKPLKSLSLKVQV